MVRSVPFGRRAPRGAAVVLVVVSILVALCGVEPGPGGRPPVGEPLAAERDAGAVGPEVVVARVDSLVVEPESGRPVGGRLLHLASAAPTPHEHGSYWMAAVVVGSDTVEVLTQNQSRHPDRREMAESDRVAHAVAATLVGEVEPADDPSPPAWTVRNTGRIDGRSAGIVATLLTIDASTPGRLGGDLQVGGSAVVRRDGTTAPAASLAAKLDAVRLVELDVFFIAPRTTLPPGAVVDGVRDAEPHGTAAVAEALALDDAVTLGRLHQHRTSPALVQVDDVLQAVAYLCGRTGSGSACGLVAFNGPRRLGELRPDGAPGHQLRARLLAAGLGPRLDRVPATRPSATSTVPAPRQPGDSVLDELGPARSWWDDAVGDAAPPT